MDGMAGKYMKLLSEENQPAKATRAMMHLFCDLVKAEYGNSDCDVAVREACLERAAVDPAGTA
jgi:hypothetical protein